jgi:tetratricopeptide (TPR) repeat protein
VEPGETRLRYRVSARLAMLRGDPATAGKSYAALAARYPNDPEILIDLAAAQGAGGELTKAVESLEKATTLDRNDPRGWFLLGKNAIQMGDAARALNDYLVRAPHSAEPAAQRIRTGGDPERHGVAHHELGQYAEALEKYSTAAAIRRRLGDQRGLATSLKNRARST